VVLGRAGHPALLCGPPFGVSMVGADLTRGRLLALLGAPQRLVVVFRAGHQRRHLKQHGRRVAHHGLRGSFGEAKLGVAYLVGARRIDQVKPSVIIPNIQDATSHRRRASAVLVRLRPIN
jgi:hypothetical protein